MKRTNLVLDEEKLEELVRGTGAKTYSAAVQKAIDEMVRRMRAEKIFDFVGTDPWWPGYREHYRPPSGHKRRRR